MAGAVAAAGSGIPAWSAEQFGPTIVQTIDEVQLYMTHYAFFEEPDPNVPPAIYIDAATGMPTNELLLTPALSQRTLQRIRPNRTELTGNGEVSKVLPYVVEPPGFPPLPAPAPVVGAIRAATDLPAAVIQANTNVLLVAMGQFLQTGPVTGKISGGNFRVDKSVHFEVRIRTGFLFTPPASIHAPGVGVLVGYLNFGLLHQLIGLPIPPNADEIVVYSWLAPMTLSTANSYIRSTATEPAPVADGFDPAMKEIRFIGSHVDNAGRYTIVGSAQHVQFIAPPELERFLFGQTSLTDVEFAVMESGSLA
jgi:hypothetical protein